MERISVLEFAEILKKFTGKDRLVDCTSMQLRCQECPLSHKVKLGNEEFEICGIMCTVQRKLKEVDSNAKVSELQNR